ncbi:deaminase [Escherichia coli]|nr:deaminase [Escherichia coli]
MAWRCRPARRRQTVEIQNGKIVALRENKQHPDATLPHYDAGDKLMLPTTRDMHIHLDKTFYGGPWRSLNRPAGTTIQDMIKLEQKMLPELQPYTQERAEKLIDLLQSKGTTIARSHCNIEPVFRSEKSAKFAGGAGATSGGLRV